MKKLKDIRHNLSENIDITPEYPLDEIGVYEGVGEKNTADILPDLPDVTLSVSQEIYIQKNRTSFFDALGKKTFFSSRTIDISGKKATSFISMKKNILFVISLGVFFIFFLLLDKNFVEQKVHSGYTKLTLLQSKKTGIEGVIKSINDARFDFLVADVAFTPFKIFPFEDISVGYHAIKGGKQLAKAADISLEIYNKTLQFTEKRDIQNVYFTQLLEKLQPDFIFIEDILTSALRHYRSIENGNNVSVKNIVSPQVEKLRVMIEKLSLLNNNFSVFLDMLGHSSKRTYLIVLQNSDEIRPMGGFMGSMVLIDVFRGKIQSFTPRDVYSFEWDLKRADYQRISPPKGIDVLTSSFGLRDANYYLNSKDSSEAIKFFIAKSGVDIDGIIYMNQNILLDILDVIGGVYFKQIDTHITSKNFSHIMSLLVESKIYKEGTQGTPKQVLFDFIEVFESELISQKKYADYLKIILQHIQSRDISFYSFHRSESKLAKALEIVGDRSYDESLDFSYPVFTSLSGNKSDRYMDRSFKKEVSFLDDDCSIQTELSLISRHMFTNAVRATVENNIKKYNIEDNNDTLLTIQGAGDNNQFVRVILPEDAIVVPKEGMEIKNYGDRKGVEFFLKTRPTETTYYGIKYELPNTECKDYSYTHYKQPGIKKYDIEVISPKKQEVFTGLQQDFFYSEK